MHPFDAVAWSFARMVESASQASLAMERAGIPHSIIGGVAVFLHVDAIEPIAARLTPDVDLAISRDNFLAAARVLESLGYSGNNCAFRHSVDPQGWRAVHLILDGDMLEPVRTKEGILIAPVDDLVRMKLTSFRLKDKVHIQDLDSVALITPEIEAGLFEPLRQRLAEVGATE